jgi:hypothetical protein
MTASMEPFYAWQSRHEAGNASSVIARAMSPTEGPAMQLARVKPTRHFKQLTLVDAICIALLS